MMMAEKNKKADIQIGKKPNLWLRALDALNIISLRENRAIHILLIQSQVSKWPVISFGKNSEKGGPMKKVPLFLIEICMASKHKQITKRTGNVPGQVKSFLFTRWNWNKRPGKRGALCQH